MRIYLNIVPFVVKLVTILTIIKERLYKVIEGDKMHHKKMVKNLMCMWVASPNKMLL